MMNNTCPLRKLPKSQIRTVHLVHLNYIFWFHCSINSRPSALYSDRDITRRITPSIDANIARDIGLTTEMALYLFVLGLGKVSMSNGTRTDERMKVAHHLA